MSNLNATIPTDLTDRRCVALALSWATGSSDYKAYKFLPGELQAVSSKLIGK